ncbi:MAG: protoporphyrinogen oxidase HemJ [Azospirillaceae bacterium]
MMAFYPWIQALHVIAVITWMAGLFYLPRLYVYHTRHPAGSPASETFKEMERKLLRIIMNPSLVAVWVFGLALIAINPALLSQGWLHAKLLAVILMSGSHGMLAKWRKDFAADANKRPERFYRLFNEVPTVLMLIVVIMVFVRPF